MLSCCHASSGGHRWHGMAFSTHGTSTRDRVRMLMGGASQCNDLVMLASLLRDWQLTPENTASSRAT